MASIPDECLGRKQGCWRLIAGIWTRASLLMAGESAAIGAGYLHALQPSQYVPDGKRLTDEEMQRAYLPDSGWLVAVRNAYPLLLAEGARLSARGIDFLDLRPAFADVKETIYIDTCCHMNETGYGMLGERIGERIAMRLAALQSRPGGNS